MESFEPFPTSRRDINRNKESIRAVNIAKSQAETELSYARKTVRNLALKIEEANSRARKMQQKFPKLPKQEERKTSFKNEDDTQYTQVMKEIEHIKQEFNKLKLDMAKVLNEKKHAEKEFESSSSKISTFSNSMETIKKEIEELDEEQVLVELARIEAVKEREAIEAQRIEEANRYKTQLENVKKKAKPIIQNNEMTKELQITLCNVNSLKNELDRAKKTEKPPALLVTVTEELEVAKMELSAIRREGFNFMASMDVIRNELIHVQEEKAKFEKEEAKKELIVQNLASKISKEKAKLEAVSVSAENANTIASNLSLTIENLQAEMKTAKKESNIISEEIENMKTEIPKTESEIDLNEKRLEAAMNELESVKLSEFKALENLKNTIDSTVKARESDYINNSTIKITNFEYEYLTRKAGGAEEIADKKVIAAQAWVEALKANEKEILMKIEMGEKEIKELSVEVEEERGDANRTGVPGGRRWSVDGELTKWGSRKYVKRVRSHSLLSPATRHAIKSASFSKRREKVMQM